MAGGILPSVARVRLADLVASEGLPSDSYKLAASALTQSFAQYSAAVIELPSAESALLRTCLESARLFFQCRSGYPPPRSTNESGEWCDKGHGSYVYSHLGLESYEYRPGLALRDLDGGMVLPPAGLLELFTVLGKASRDTVDAVGFSLNLRSSILAEMLDNVPLRSGEASSSVLSVCCHSRPSFEAEQQNGVGAYEDENSAMLSDNEDQVDKALVTLVKPNKAGLHVKDLHGQWTLVDGDLGPHDLVAYTGLALYQLTDGFLGPALYKIETGDPQESIHGRFSLVFKLVPKSMVNLSSPETRSTANGVDSQFQLHIPVDDFMQRSQINDQLFPKNETGELHAGPDANLKFNAKKKCSSLRSKALPPSKRLRLEAQRVLKERVQDIADKKGIKLRFCNLKECEGHIRESDSPCEGTRQEIGWPSGVPFAHPHDLPNKAKLSFLEAFEPGWSDSHQDIESHSP